MRPFRLLLLTLAAFVTTLGGGCSTATVPPPPTPALLRVAVTDLTEPLLLDLAAAYAAAQPMVALAPRPAREAELAGLLQAGEVDLALTTAPDPQLFATPLGYIPFRLVVHPSNDLDTLSLAQAQSLFAGETMDWENLGGRIGRVQVVTRPTDGDAARALSQTPMGVLTVTVNALVAPTWDAMRELVAGGPNSIGYLMTAGLDSSVKPLVVTDADGVRLDLRLLAAAEAAGPPSGPARDFLAWAQSPAGQAAVADRHERLAP
jgi:ABC-type phosphate transport system substrate-binding protein